tara:strand:- start:53 stop:331 length:279 start_codon:yes stop_codon:yes gene_type:complete
MVNAWLAHVKATMKLPSSKGLKFKDILKAAKKTYKKGVAAVRERISKVTRKVKKAASKVKKTLRRKRKGRKSRKSKGKKGKKGRKSRGRKRR